MINRSIVFVVLLALMLTLTACGKSEFGVTENTWKHMTITAQNAGKDAFFMVGALEVVDGEQIDIAADLTKGSVRVEIVRSPDNQDINEIPEMDGKAIITADLARTEGASGTVPAGTYLLRATCLEKATGTIQIEVKPVEGIGSEDSHELQAAVTEIDYLALVNKLNPLPDGWEDAIETVTITNSVGDEVEAEAKAYAAYELLKADLEENNGIYLELDSARRSVAAQQDIMDRFIEKYGADYAAKTVAQPGYSEHHTGLALDLYFKIRNEDGSFTDVYYNEDMEKPEYTWIWDAIHAKLADYGFILRYLTGEEHITGYRYEPWHIRYLDSVEIAREIMSQPGMTLEEYLAGQSAPEVMIDLSGSSLYTEDELFDAMLAIKCKFASWPDCELHSIRYAGDEANSEENLAWLNSLVEGGEFTQAAEFLMDYHSPVEDGPYAWEPDTEYTDYQWWLARTENGDWEIVSWGY